MRIIAEAQVPDAIRLRESARVKPADTQEVGQLKEIRTLLHTISEALRVPPAAPVVDLTPVVAALKALPRGPVEPPRPTGGWTFSIERDADGLMTNVHAARTP